MATNSSKYSFLLSNDNDNFVVNSDGYNFDYLFTTYADKSKREYTQEQSKSPQAVNTFKTGILGPFIKSLNDNSLEQSLEQFKLLFTPERKEDAKKILSDETFIKRFGTDKIFKNKFKAILDELDPDNKDNKDDIKYLKTFSEIIKELPETNKNIYLKNEDIDDIGADIGVILSLFSNNN